MAQMIPPEADQAGAPQGAAEPAPGQDAGGGGKIASLMSETFKNLATLSELIGAAGDKDMAQKLQAIKAQFEGLLDGGSDPGASPQGGAVPMEAGAAKVSPAL